MFNFKDSIILFLKGIAIGASNILPSVSGATIALVLGIYERLISAISHFFEGFFLFRKKKNFLNDIYFLVLIGLGAVFGILFFANILNLFFEKFSVVMNALFSGFAIASMCLMCIREKNLNFKTSFSFLVGIFSMLLFMTFFSFFNADYSPSSFILGGFLAGVAMIIPGISGSLVLVALNLYQPLIRLIADFSQLNWSNSLPFLSFFFLGFVLGVGICACGLKKIFSSSWRCQAIFFVAGSILGSLLSFWFNAKNEFPFLLEGQIFLASLFFFLGIFLYAKLYKSLLISHS